MDDQKKGVTVRFPSTANLLIDSTDRTSGTSADFSIALRQSILNGFFTRLAVVEVVLDWCVDNVSEGAGNNTFTINDGTSDFTATIPDGHYTVASLLDALVVQLNAAGSSITFSKGGGTVGNASLVGSKAFTIVFTNLSQELDLVPVGAGPSFTEYVINCPLILPFTYIDFTSQQLTYCQDLKDATTNSINRDTLYRWYFAWDGPAPTDAYGYPINQGYMPFVQRRYLAFPKQIKWDNIQPIGQMSFQAYDSQGVLLDVGVGEMEFRMTLLVSEQ
jgi:hypothetical protein